MPLLNNNMGYQSEGISKSNKKNTSMVSRQRGQVSNPGGSTDPNRASYQPVPDGRFYTKANFFTLRNNSREGAISE